MAKIEVQGNELIIRVNLDVAGALSSSGKSHVLDSTNGFVGLSTAFGMAKIGLNIITSDDNWCGGGKAPEQRRAAVAAPSLVKGNGVHMPAAAAAK
jgi:hypothetical protein